MVTAIVGSQKYLPKCVIDNEEKMKRIKKKIKIVIPTVVTKNGYQKWLSVRKKTKKKSVSLKISTVTTLFSMVTVAPPHDPLPNRYRYCVEYSLGKFDLVMLKLCSSNSVL